MAVIFLASFIINRLYAVEYDILMLIPIADTAKIIGRYAF